MSRGRDLKLEYIGMIPSSLELNKLISVGLKTTKKKTSEKLLSSDVINVKFKQKVDSGVMIIKRIKEKIIGLNIREVKLEDESDKEKAEESKQKIIAYRENLNKFINKIEEEIKLKEFKDKWKGVKNDVLRNKLYVNGFIYNETKYVVYKRSSAKSRIGQCLFIKETLYNEMIQWSRMSLDFKAVENIDYPSLLAYESLVGSSIENIISIKPENILIIEDVESKFNKVCNVIRTGEDGYLNSFVEEAEITNSLFDGESLLDSSYFTEGKAMMLLRNHMFKSAAFNTNIQEYFKRECPDEIIYEEWTLPNMFGEPMFAQNIHLVITPSSLKALKFSHTVGSQTDMWNYWKEIVLADECKFGVCKSEKKSRHGNNENGNIIQQTSYQMLNSLQMSEDDITQLSLFEREFIDKLKNDDDFFISYISGSSNITNSNDMFSDVYEKNKDIVRTKLFRKFRTEAINAHLTHVKNGKCRLQGDYLTMLGNPLEYLLHTVGKLIVDGEIFLDILRTTIRENEIYTTLFEFDKEVTGFRNPHTSPSNVLVSKNIYVPDIETYFNLTSNIVCVNAINFPLQDILSSCDYDSDTVLMLEDSHLLSISKQIFGKYKVCINQVSSSKKKYNICNEDMAVIDNELSKSQKYIGRTVNLGQLCMSTYWDLLSKGSDENNLINLMKKIDVMTVLSCICIDMAKKMFQINIKKEIDYVSKTRELKTDKPLFWKYVTENKDVLTVKYDCPMDYLFEEMSGLEQADQRLDLSMKFLLTKGNVKKGDRHQQKKITDYVKEKCQKIHSIYGRYAHDNLTDNEKKERDRLLDDTIKYYEFYVGKLKVSEDTMYSLLLKIASNKKDNIATKMLNVLHKTQKDVFLSTFKVKNSTL